LAFSTYMAVVNRVLLNTGEAQIATALDFANAGGNLLTKEQNQCKSYVDKVNRRIIRRGRLRYLRKKGTITTSAASNVYTLPDGVNIEDLVSDSFYITTAGMGSGPLQNITFTEWTHMFPSGETGKSVPRMYFNYDAAGSDVDTIGFSPPPSGVFTIQYEYYMSPLFLTDADDEVQIRMRDEDILWDNAQKWLEISNSQGKGADFAILEEQIVAELWAANQGDRSRPPSVTFRFRPFGLRRGNGLYVYSPET